MELASNRKARFNYEILDTYEAGLELFGFEVKSIKKGMASLDGSHAIIRGGEIFLVGCQVQPYQVANTPVDYDPLRTRRLLLRKKEINELLMAGETKGLTVVPLSLYNVNSKVKIKIALAKGKKLHDKRETIKKRETDRELRREFKAH